MAEQIPTSLEYPLNALGVDPTAAVNEAKANYWVRQLCESGAIGTVQAIADSKPW